MKTCPFCIEQIQDDAVKCRYCHEFLTPEARAQDEAAKRRATPVKVRSTATADGKSKKGPWYTTTMSLIIAFCCVGPFMLPLVWWHPTFSRQRKLIWTAVILVITLLCVKILAWATVQIKATYAPLMDALGH